MVIHNICCYFRLFCLASRFSGVQENSEKSEEIWRNPYDEKYILLGYIQN